MKKEEMLNEAPYTLLGIDKYYGYNTVSNILDKFTKELQEQLAESDKKILIEKECNAMLQKQLAEKDKEFIELKNKLEELINLCINNSISFKASGMDRSQMCSNAMATAYNVVLDYINTPK